VSLANNDWNWRLVAGAAIAENQAVKVNGAGKAVPAGGVSGDANGFCPQAIASGERAPIIRGGKLGGLVGFSAGARLRVQADGTLGTAGTQPIVAVVVSEDAATAVILTENLSSGFV
jgi:hypothetical protein